MPTFPMKSPLVAGNLGGTPSLYVEIAPHREILPNLFMCLITVTASSPPTLSKKQSTPLGAPSFKASLADI